MINVIGVRRLIVLAVLVAANVLLAGFVYQYTMPEIKTVRQQLNTTRSYNATKQDDIKRMQVEFDQLGQQQSFFDRLKEDDFFSTQSRRDAEAIFLRAEADSGVISAKVKVSPGQRLENEEAKKADYVILESPITINLEAISDPDIYRYLYILQKLFPGHLSTEALRVERTANLKDEVLRAIASGKEPALVKGTLELTWRTMVPVQALEEEGF